MTSEQTPPAQRKRNAPKVTRTGDGEQSEITVDWPPLPRFVMSQAEARALVSELSKVTLLPPRRGTGRPDRISRRDIAILGGDPSL